MNLKRWLPRMFWRTAECAACGREGRKRDMWFRQSINWLETDPGDWWCNLCKERCQPTRTKGFGGS